MGTKIQTSKIRKSFNGSEQRKIFKLLADTNRYRIFEMLAKRVELTVSEIAEILKISLPLSSQHLKMMELGGVLEKEKHGQNVYYRQILKNNLAQLITKYII